MRYTTESGRVYEADIEDGFWGRSPNFWPQRIWAFGAGSEKVTPWDKPEAWDLTRMPVVGEHLYIGSRDQWYVSNKIVSIEEV